MILRRGDQIASLHAYADAVAIALPVHLTEQRMTESEARKSARTAIVTAVIAVAATGSLASVFVVGNRQRSVLLMTMFIVWVLSPYVGLWLANVRVRDGTPAARRALEYATILISLAALGRYLWVLVRPLAHQPASTFLLVPFVSWIAIAVAVGVAMRSAR